MDRRNILIVEYMREKGNLDCIIMDVSLKGDYSGIEAAEEIHKEHSVPVFLPPTTPFRGYGTGYALPSAVLWPSLLKKPSLSG